MMCSARAGGCRETFLSAVVVIWKDGWTTKSQWEGFYLLKFGWPGLPLILTELQAVWWVLALPSDCFVPSVVQSLAKAGACSFPHLSMEVLSLSEFWVQSEGPHNMKQPANGSEAGCQWMQVCHLWALGEVRGMRGARTSCLCRGGQCGARLWRRKFSREDNGILKGRNGCIPPGGGKIELCWGTKSSIPSLGTQFYLRKKRTQGREDSRIQMLGTQSDEDTWPRLWPSICSLSMETTRDWKSVLLRVSVLWDCKSH